MNINIKKTKYSKRKDNRPAYVFYYMIFSRSLYYYRCKLFLFFFFAHKNSKLEKFFEYKLPGRTLCPVTAVNFSPYFSFSPNSLGLALRHHSFDLCRCLCSCLIYSALSTLLTSQNKKKYEKNKIKFTLFNLVHTHPGGGGCFLMAPREIIIDFFFFYKINTVDRVGPGDRSENQKKYFALLLNVLLSKNIIDDTYEL